MANKIYRISDRIKVNVGGLVIVIGPLTFDQKSEIQALAASGDFKKALESAKLAVKYGVKDVIGLKDSEDKDWKPSYDESGLATDSLDELLNLEVNESIQMVCLNLINGIPNEFKNPFTKDKLKSVSIVKEGAEKKK